jgi:hypothetical protein
VSVPSDHAITLAAATFGNRWLSADQIHGRLVQWGFERLKTQRVVARLRAMCEEGSPRFERHEASWTSRPFWEYRVTRCGYNELDNRNPGIRCYR